MRCLHYFAERTNFSTYIKATEKPYSFLYCDLQAKTEDDIFYYNFDEKINIYDFSES